jgi:hypothetical protein
MTKILSHEFEKDPFARAYRGGQMIIIFCHQTRLLPENQNSGTIGEMRHHLTVFFVLPLCHLAREYARRRKNILCAHFVVL